MCTPGRCIYTLEVMQARGVAWGLRDRLASCPHPGGLGSGGQEVRGERSEAGVRLGVGVGLHGRAGCLGKTSPRSSPGILEEPVQRPIHSLTLLKAPEHRSYQVGLPGGPLRGAPHPQSQPRSSPPASSTRPTHMRVPPQRTHPRGNFLLWVQGVGREVRAGHPQGWSQGEDK